MQDGTNGLTIASLSGPQAEAPSSDDHGLFVIRPPQNAARPHAGVKRKLDVEGAAGAPTTERTNCAGYGPAQAAS